VDEVCLGLEPAMVIGTVGTVAWITESDKKPSVGLGLFGWKATVRFPGKRSWVQVQSWTSQTTIGGLAQAIRSCEAVSDVLKNQPRH